MRYALKKLYRMPVKTIIFILLISLSVSALSISAGMWKYSYDSIKHSKDAFTTIGILREIEFTEQIYKNSVKPKYNYELLSKVKQAAASSQYAKYTDIREYLMGYSPDMTSVGNLAANNGLFPYAYSIITGVCESVGYSNYADYSAVIKIDKDDLNILPNYVVEDPEYEDIEYIGINGTSMTTDLDFPFKVGKKYIIYTYIGGYDYENKRWQGKINYRNLGNTDYEEYYVLSEEEKKEHPEYSRDFVYKILDDSMLLCHILSTDAQSFLDSGNEKWNEIVNNCRITKHSTEILLTDDMYSIYTFNVGDTFVYRGRIIRKDEYEKGAKVCLINSTFAYVNGLNIGDKIKLAVYESEFAVGNKLIRSPVTGSTVGENDSEDYFAPLGYKGQGFITEIEYEIVGMYRLPPSAERGELLISQNVLIAPSKSIEGDFNTKPTEAEVVRDVDGTIQRFKMERTSIPGSFSVVIENGKTKEFEEEMAALGYGGMFYYFDQNYSQISGILDGYLKTASFIVLISILAWVCIAAVFLSIYMISSRKSLATMLSLGSGRIKAFMSEMTGISVIILIASILGMIAGMILYGKVINQTITLSLEGLSTSTVFYDVINSEAIRSPKVVWLSVIIQAAVLMLIAAAIEYSQSGQDVLKLMKGLKRKKNGKKN
ncbi:MAG: hypothetical protein PHY13_07975 [Clostridia bacterium]|nr:hypothetical protein [Clostridia bacterium]MDD3972598.1 hypothetical protein [Clostridia bacterium]MDD4543689.1 hypothetical protein [Clostridia bacterium]